MYQVHFAPRPQGEAGFDVTLTNARHVAVAADSLIDEILARLGQARDLDVGATRDSDGVPSMLLRF